MKYHPRRFQMAAFLLFSALCVSLFGCEGAIVYGVGKTYLDKQRAPIYVTRMKKKLPDVISSNKYMRAAPGVDWHYKMKR
jgi:hypothetical protein